VETIGFIGSGNMAEALINGVLKAGVYRPGKVYVSDVRPERVEYLREHYGVRPAANNADLSRVDILVLSVKPQNDAASKTSRAVSMVRFRDHAAGIRTSRIAAVLGDVAVVRVMPNMPAWVKEGASVLYANEKARTKVEKARLIFLSVGKAIVVEDEKLLDPVTAVSGSGPAYFFLLMQEMIKAAVAMGLEEEQESCADGPGRRSSQKAAGEGRFRPAAPASPRPTARPAAFKIFQARLQ
jgi:pyrroline-5-carboxylate reductase